MKYPILYNKCITRREDCALILYFSVTGNSEYVAKRLAAALDDEAVSITECIRNERYLFKIKEGEDVGLVSPVYAWTLPYFVGNYINKSTFEFTGTPYVYFVATYGRNAGNSANNVKADFAHHKLKLKAQFGVKMVDTFTPFYYVNDAKENASIEKKTDPQIDKIVEHIKNKDADKYIKDIASPLAARIAQAYYEKSRKTAKFIVGEGCTGCGKCQEVCPEGIIKIEDGKPVWTDEACLLCLACYHHCPAYAIQHGKSTKDKGQYTNPNV